MQPGSSGVDGGGGTAPGTGQQQQQDALTQQQQQAVCSQQQQQQQQGQLPVVICGDFNSLWKKYLADAFDRGVSH